MTNTEKKFDLGHRVRIIGPTIKGDETYVGECFTIDQMLVSTDKIHGYSRHDRNQFFPASSLELVKSESDRLDAIEQRLDSIEKRLQPPEALTIIPGFKIVYPNSNIAKEWNIEPITTEIKTPVKDNHLIIAIDKLLYRLGSIEKRLQTLEDKARADTSTQKRKDADSGDKGMDLSGFW